MLKYKYSIALEIVHFPVWELQKSSCWWLLWCKIMMSLVFIWLLFRYQEFSLKWLYVFIFMSIHAVRELHNLIHLITYCKMGMALPEGRPTCLVYVPPELITHFLCLRTERTFLSVPWPFGCGNAVFCWPRCSVNHSTAASPACYWSSKTIAAAFMKTVLWWGKTLYDDSWG